MPDAAMLLNAEILVYGDTDTRTSFDVSDCTNEDLFAHMPTAHTLSESLYVYDASFMIIADANMYSMFHTMNGADMTLIVKGERISAHRSILTARSGYFEVMFNSGRFVESSKTEVLPFFIPSYHCSWYTRYTLVVTMPLSRLRAFVGVLNTCTLT